MTAFAASQPSADIVAAYERDGYVVVRGLIPDVQLANAGTRVCRTRLAERH